jgi:hypothetical protein
MNRLITTACLAALLGTTAATAAPAAAAPAVTSAPAAAKAKPVAAKARYVTEDQSTEALISKAAVAAVWKEVLPEERLRKLYPAAKWGFLSQVEGGIASNQTCVVTARVAMLPRTAPTRRLVWEPSKMSTTFDAKPSATAAQCSELAAAKLKEAVQSLVSSLVKS